MASIIYQKGSKFYWLQVYDKLETDQKKRIKRFSSKIEITKADQQRIIDKKPLNGNKELKELINSLESGIVKRNISFSTNTKLNSSTRTLLQGFSEYININTRQGDKSALKRNTIDLYRLAVNHLITVASDKEIRKYKQTDFNNLLIHFQELGLKQNSKAIYTKHLHKLFSYFLDKNYCSVNIIEKVEEEIKEEPEDIPLDDLNVLLNHFKETNINRYNIVYYMLLTMTRPSSVVVQELNFINFDKKFIKILNVKAQRKQKPYYVFPLFKELSNHINNIISLRINNNDSRLFNNFPLLPKYTEIFRFWYRANKKLFEKGLIKKTYELKQVRKTFPSFAVNYLNFQDEEIRFLLDHTSEDVSRNYYLNKKIEIMVKKFDSVNFNF